MTYIKIPTQYNDSMSSVFLDRTRYFIRFTYNVVSDWWTMSLYDADRNPIITCLKLIPNYPMNHYCKSDNAPNGIFSLVSMVEKDVVSTSDIKNGLAYLVYIPYDELAENIKIYEE